MGILNGECIEVALQLSKPSILAILNDECTTWGPKWITGFATGPGLLEERIGFEFGEAPGKIWDDKWETPEKHILVAKKNIDLVIREKCSSSVIIATRPWLLDSGEFLYTGGAYCDGIAVAVAGARGRVNEAIAEIIISTVKMLVYLETDYRIRIDQMDVR